MQEPLSPAVERVVACAKDDPGVLAVMLFGSRVRGEAGPESDFDVCLVLSAKPDSEVALARKRLDYLEKADVDLAVFPSASPPSPSRPSRP